MLGPYADRYHPIQDYGIIGDCYTAALVGPNGAIDFMCWPSFDSPSLFAAMLDSEKGGRFQIAPVESTFRQKKIYLPNTNVLLSRFLLDSGVLEVTDFMAIGNPTWPRMLVRRAKVVRGEIKVGFLLAPRFNYARSGHTCTATSDGYVIEETGGNGLRLRLRASIPVQVQGDSLHAEFVLKQGDTASFTLEVMGENIDSPTAHEHFVTDAFKETVNYWRRWIARSTYRGRWREMVNRSALTLKLLTAEPYGSLVAAPTFGLPEHLGGVRNWDYRYTWIRDSSFSLYALMRLGFIDEAGRFMTWIRDRLGDGKSDPPLQIMYGIDGRSDLRETELLHLEGYCGSRPVRIGNGAAHQLQLDIYGELFDSIYLYDKFGTEVSYDMWQVLINVLSWLGKNWRRKDEGIWEVRGGQQHFLFSRFMCWVAFDRGLRLAAKRAYPAPVAEWMAIRDEIYKSVFTDFWNEERQAFIQHIGSTALDASSLLMPLVKFISPRDPRWLSTLRAIESQLVEDSLVYRYLPDSAAPDGLGSFEGTFSMCSFWYIETLARSGDLEQARYFFEKMLTHANRLGLYAEEIGSSGENLGNFPQAFTHLALISTAFDLDRRLDAAGISV